MENGTEDDYLKNHVKHVEVNFGDVEIGVINLKSIKIENQSDIRQFYKVQRDPTSNTMDSVFQIDRYNWSLEPNDFYLCDISYKPCLPNRRYVDYFFITDSNDCRYEVLIRGNSIGPLVTISTKKLIFIRNEMKNKQTIRLTNDSNFSIKFNFDVDLIQCPFKINERNGIVKGGTSKSFDVTYLPIGNGIHRYNLTCLISNHEPIIIELFGIPDNDFSQTTASKIDELSIATNDNNFTNYMSDVTTIVKNHTPFVSLTVQSLDFGFAKIGMENSGNRPPRTTSLTNHTNFGLLVIWDNDIDNAFKIQPNESKMLGYRSIIFEIRFDPDKKDKFYSRELLGRIYRLPCCPSLIKSKNDESIANLIPEIVSVRLIGHTFEKNSDGSLMQCEIPDAVIMPAAVPALPVYHTFVLKNSNDRPLAFSFVPPDITNYTLKPMMGLLTTEQKHQVIVVQLFGEDNDQAYVERWACRLNDGVTNKQVYIDFRGFAELPKLTFGQDNQVVFDPVHVDCQEFIVVPICNSTRHAIRFDLSSINFPKQLYIQEMCGIVNPNETIFHNWTFRPERSLAYNFVLDCRLFAENFDKQSDIEIDVFGTSVEGSLIAEPEIFDFGILEYNESKTMQFKLFNFSPVTINFLLTHKITLSMESKESTKNDVEILPAIGTIRPGKSKTINVRLTCLHPGRHEVSIDYLTRSSSTSDDFIITRPPKRLCKFNYSCYLSALKIKDLLYQAESNKNLSKISLWKSLNVDDFNATLMNLTVGKNTTMDMTLPFDFLNEDEKFVVKLLLVNVNPVKATWIFKKKKNCFCNDTKEKKRKQRSSTLTNKCKIKNECCNCILDDSCNIFPENILLMPNEDCVLTIELTKNPLSKSGLFWDLNVGQNRKIRLNLNLERPLITSGDFLKFKKISIGLCLTVQYQAMWLYNDAMTESKYYIDTKNLALFNKNNYGVISTCLHPEGTIEPRNRKAVLFGFRINRIGRFEVNTMVKIGEKETLLKIEVEVVSSKLPIVSSCGTCPASYTFLSDDIVVYFNMDCIVVPPIPIYGKETKIVMIHNHHLSNVLHYQWENYEIPGVVKVDVKPSNGLIQPQSLLTFLIEVIAGQYSCGLSLDLFCNFTDVEERRLAEKEKVKRNELLKQMNDEFTITEKGITFPKKPIFKPIKKPSTYCKTLTLKINIFNSRYREDRVELKQHLKSMPTKGIERNMMPCCSNTYPAKDIKIFSQIIEGIIWNLLNSQSFARALRKDLTKVHHLKYSQLPKNTTERKRQSERSRCLPPKRYIEDILRNMISTIVHEEFNLSTDHFSHPTDARQISYRKTPIEVKKATRISNIPLNVA